MLDHVFKSALVGLNNHKISRDLAYSGASFLVLAITGILINVVISVLRNPVDLGIFNLSYAIYIMASQLAACGIHYSVLRYSAFYQQNIKERTTLFYSAVMITLCLGLISAFALYQAQGVISGFFKGDNLAAAIGFIAFGLLFFPLNKVLLAYLNGLQCIKVFSILQGLRYLIILAVVLSVSCSKRPIDYACWCFFMAEATTTCLAFFYILSNQLVHGFTITRYWIKKHVLFGSQSIMAGIFVELNSRIDVLLIGLYLSEYHVGIYSFIAMLVEGIYQILSMIRLNFNPLLIGYIRDKQWEKILQLRQTSKKFILLTTLLLALLVITAYFLFSHFVVADKGLQQGIPSLIILLLGIITICTVVPFDNLMLITGYPLHQTMQQMTIVCINIVLTAIMLPYFGIMGAAMGTVAGNCAGILFLNRYVNHLMGWQLIKNAYQGDR